MDNKNNIKVSISVAIYNTEEYLVKCLDSLSAQTLREIEIILVDDGSTDKSPEICDSYARRDERFRVIHKKNGGLSSARQAGLNSSCGEYVITCDSDDWVESDMIEKLYNQVKIYNADIAICGFCFEYSNGKSVPYQVVINERHGIIDNTELLEKEIGSSCNKLVRRTLYEETGAYYESGINLGEDNLILYKLLLGNPRITQIKANSYHYRRRLGENSYTNKVTMTSLKQLIYIYTWFNQNYPQSTFDAIRIRRAIDLAITCLRTENLDHDFYRDFLREELPWEKIIKSRNLMKACVVGMQKICPLSLLKYCFNIIYPFLYR